MIKKVLIFIFFLFFSFFIFYNIKFSSYQLSSSFKQVPSKISTVYFTSSSDRLFDSVYFTKNNTEVPNLTDNNSVILKLHASALNFSDFILHDNFNFYKQNKIIPCSDFSGIIVQSGSNVKKFQNGDKVFGQIDIFKNLNGACSEYIQVSQDDLIFKPISINHFQAAALPTTSVVVYDIIKHIENFDNKTDVKIFIDDATNDIGAILSGLHYSIQKKDVYSVDSEVNRSILSKLGVTDLISDNDFESKYDSYKEKFEVVYNVIHFNQIEKLIKLVKPNGIFFTLSVDEKKISNMKKIFPNVKIISYYDILSSGVSKNEKIQFITKLVHKGEIPVFINKIFKLEKFRDAMKAYDKKDNNGKIIIDIAGKN